MKARLLVVSFLLLFGGRLACGQGTAFTYQGQLSANGAPANGNYDLLFILYDAALGGDQTGPILTNTATPVISGLFAVTLDFGAGVFRGSGYWLEIDVRTNGQGPFTTLSPRQPLTPVPYAIFAATASNIVGSITPAQLAGPLPAAQISGSLTLAQLPGVVVTNNQRSVDLSGTFSGDGAGLTNLQVNGMLNSVATPICTVPLGSNVQAQPNVGYLLTTAQQVIVSLPASPNVGDTVEVVEVGNGGWVIAQNVWQWISGSFVPLWVETSAPILQNSVYRIASSSDGTNLVAAGSAGGIYISTNAGATWIQTSAPTNQHWNCVASSSDGTKLAAGAYNGGIYSGGIYISKDSGTSWTVTSATTNEAWTSIASSSDGTELVASAGSSPTGPGGIYSSVDSGGSWTQTSAPTNQEQWTSIALSSDGTKVAAIGTGGVYTSSNSGGSWTQTGAPSANWRSVASSSNGTQLVITSDDAVYISSNSGTNWTQANAPTTNVNWSSVASSYDGTKLAVASFSPGGVGSGIWISTNSGFTWTQTSAATNSSWSSIVSSSDGTKLFASEISASVSGVGVYSYHATAGSATTVGISGFLEGGTGTSVELIYVGGGQFAVEHGSGAFYDY